MYVCKDDPAFPVLFFFVYVAFVLEIMMKVSVLSLAILLRFHFVLSIFSRSYYFSIKKV